MNITILGTGNIGGTLGRHWAKAGHRIYFGARDQQKPDVQALLAQCGGRATVHSLLEATQQGTVIVFAIPATAMNETITLLTPHLVDKILIDTTNNVRGTPQSAVEALRQAAAKSQIYRAFNSIGWENIENPKHGGIQADLIFCGSPEQRAVAEQLISETGMNPVYIGGLDQTPIVDMMTKLWFALAFGQAGGRRISFKVLRD